MATTVTFDITSDDYVSVETTASMTFTSGTAYSIQGLNGDYKVRRGSSGEGIYVPSLEKWTYNSDGEDIEIKKMHQGALTITIID